MAGPAVAAPSQRAVPLDGPTASNLTLSTHATTFGQEDLVKLSVGVSDTGSPGSTSPSGRVQVLEGTTVLCTFQILFQNGSCFLTDSQLSVGAHTLRAVYFGDGVNTPSTSPNAQLTVAKGQPTAQVSLGQAGITMEYGLEGLPEVTLTATQAGSVLPTGTMSVTEVSGPLLCSVNLAGGNSGTCHIPDGSALAPGQHQLVGSYSGDANYNAVTSAPLTINVIPERTSLEEIVPVLGVSADQEAGAELSFTIVPDAPATVPPSGTITFSTGGATLCTVQDQIGALTGSCALTAGELAPGSYVVSADYSGDAFYDPSSAAPATLVITPPAPVIVPTATTLTVSAPTATFGHEQAEKLSVQVGEPPAVTGKITPRAAVPAGQVTIKAGSVSVCVVTLADGKGSCAVGASKLRPGGYQLTASYGGSATFRASVSAPVALTVAAEPTGATLTLSASKVKAGKEQTEKLSVRVAPKYSGTATGKVTVKAGSVKVCVITLKAGLGSCKLTASQLKAGTYHLTAGYAAAPPFAASVSAAKTLTVTKK